VLVYFQGKTVEWALRKHGDPDIRWSAQGMMRLTQEAMRKLFIPTIHKIKEAVGSVMVANGGNTGKQLLFSGVFFCHHFLTIIDLFLSYWFRYLPVRRLWFSMEHHDPSL